MVGGQCVVRVKNCMSCNGDMAKTALAPGEGVGGGMQATWPCEWVAVSAQCVVELLYSFIHVTPVASTHLSNASPFQTPLATLVYGRYCTLMEWESAAPVSCIRSRSCTAHLPLADPSAMPRRRCCHAVLLQRYPAASAGCYEQNRPPPPHPPPPSPLYSPPPTHSPTHTGTFTAIKTNPLCCNRPVQLDTLTGKARQRLTPVLPWWVIAGST
jgi:hypothetical protein